MHVFMSCFRYFVVLCAWTVLGSSAGICLIWLVDTVHKIANLPRFSELEYVACSGAGSIFGLAIALILIVIHASERHEPL